MMRPAGLTAVVVGATSGLLAFGLAVAPFLGEAMANPKLILSTWRIEPSTVKENQPWTVKLWVANVGSEGPKKPFTIQVLGCDKEFAKCETVYATEEVKAVGELAPGKLPGKEIQIPISKGLGKGEHFIQFVVDAKKDAGGEPLKKNVRVPVGFQKF